METLDVSQIAAYCCIEEKAVYPLARRDVDPLPLRIIRGKRRGAFAFSDELRGWLERNSVPFADARDYANESMKG